MGDMTKARDIVVRAAGQYRTKTQAAKALGISLAHLSNIAAGRIQPGRKLLARLGYERRCALVKVCGGDRAGRAGASRAGMTAAAK